MTFGHIAHYNRMGFYGAFFQTTEDKIRFIKMIVEYPCYGDSKYTYSDVESEIQAQIVDMDTLGKLLKARVNEIDAKDRAEYERLKVKYAGM